MRNRSRIRRIVARETPLAIRGDGSQQKSFLDVEDVATALLRMAEEGLEEVEFCNPNMISIKELAEQIMQIEGITLPIVFDSQKLTGSFDRCSITVDFRRTDIKTDLQKP